PGIRTHDLVNVPIQKCDQLRGQSGGASDGREALQDSQPGVVVRRGGVRIRGPEAFGDGGRGSSRKLPLDVLVLEEPAAEQQSDQPQGLDLGLGFLGPGRLQVQTEGSERVDLRQEPLHVGVLKVRDSVGFEPCRSRCSQSGWRSWALTPGCRSRRGIGTGRLSLLGPGPGGCVHEGVEGGGSVCDEDVHIPKLSVQTHKLVVYELGDFEEGGEQSGCGSGGCRDGHPAEQLAQAGGALRGYWPPGHSGDGAQSVREGALGASPGEALQGRGEPGVGFGVSSVGGLEVLGESSHVEEALAELVGDDSVEALEVPKHGREDAGVELGVQLREGPVGEVPDDLQEGAQNLLQGLRREVPESVEGLEQVDQEVDLGSEGLVELRGWRAEGGDEHAGLLRDWPEVRNGGEEPRSLVEEEARETAAEDLGVREDLGRQAHEDVAEAQIVDLGLRELEPGSPQGDCHVPGELLEDQEVVEEVVDAALENMELPEEVGGYLVELLDRGQGRDGLEELSGREGVGDADEHPRDEGLVVQGLREVHVDSGVRLAPLLLAPLLLRFRLRLRLREVVDVVGVEHVRRDGSQDLSCCLEGGGVCQEGSRQLVVEAVVFPEGERDRLGVAERGLLGRGLVQEPVDESGGLLEVVRVGTVFCPDPDGALRPVGLALREVVDNDADVREDEREGGPRGGGEVLGELQSDERGGRPALEEESSSAGLECLLKVRVPRVSQKQLLELGELVDYGGDQRDESRAGSGSGGQVREHGQEKEGVVLDGGGPAEDAEDALKVVEELENQRVSADLGSQIPDSDQPLPEQDSSIQDRDLESVHGIGRLGAQETDPPRAQVRGPQADQGVVREGQINALAERVSGLESPPEVHMARVQEPQPVRRGLRGVSGSASCSCSCSCSRSQEGDPGLDKAARDEGGFPEAGEDRLGVEAAVQDVLRRGGLRESQRPGDVAAEAGPGELVEVGHGKHVPVQLEVLCSSRQGADEGSQGLRGREDDVDGVASEEGEGVGSEEGVDGLELGERQISEGEPVSAGDEREDGLRDALVGGDGPYPGEDVDQEKDEAVDIVELSDVEVELHGSISRVHGHESPGFVGGGDPKEGLVPLNGDDVFGVDGLEELQHLCVPESRQGGQLRGELREHVERSSGEGPGLVEGESGAGDAGEAGVGAVEGLDDEREEPGEVLGDEQGESVDFREARLEPLAAEPVNPDSVQDVDPEQDGLGDRRGGEEPQQVRLGAQRHPGGGQGGRSGQDGLQVRPDRLGVRVRDPGGGSEGTAASLSGAGEAQVEVGDSEERAPELEVGEEEWVREELEVQRRGSRGVEEVQSEVLNDEVRQILEAGSDGRGLEEAPDGVLRVQVAPEVDDVGQVVSVQVEVAGQEERVGDKYTRVPTRARCKIL
ncbi:hypothetical protein OJ252_3419, partial [Cryptosporidium canis]